MLVVSGLCQLTVDSAQAAGIVRLYTFTSQYLGCNATAVAGTAVCDDRGAHFLNLADIMGQGLKWNIDGSFCVAQGKLLRRTYVDQLSAFGHDSFYVYPGAYTNQLLQKSQHVIFFKGQK